MRPTKKLLAKLAVVATIAVSTQGCAGMLAAIAMGDPRGATYRSAPMPTEASDQLKVRLVRDTDWFRFPRLVAGAGLGYGLDYYTASWIAGVLNQSQGTWLYPVIALDTLYVGIFTLGSLNGRLQEPSLMVTYKRGGRLVKSISTPKAKVGDAYEATIDMATIRAAASEFPFDEVSITSGNAVIFSSATNPVLGATVRGIQERKAANQPRPRIMVVIPETHVGAQPPDPAGETEIIRLLTEAGYIVVDQQQSLRVRSDDQAMAQIRGDAAQVAALGREYGAEILVVGEGFSETAVKQRGLAKVMARVEARAVRCDTAEVLAADGHESEAPHGAELVMAKRALRTAGAIVGNSLIDQLDRRLSREAMTTQPVELLISGLDYSGIVEVSAKIRAIAGVGGLRQRSFDANQARLDIEFGGDPAGFLSTFAAMEVEGRRFTVLKATDRKAELILQAAPKAVPTSVPASRTAPNLSRQAYGRLRREFAASTIFGDADLAGMRENVTLLRRLMVRENRPLLAADLPREHAKFAVRAEKVLQRYGQVNQQLRGPAADRLVAEMNAALRELGDAVQTEAERSMPAAE